LTRSGVVECRVVDQEGAAQRTLDRPTLERQLAHGFFWLDVKRPTEDDLALLGDVFGFHPLALEDSTHFGQRPKLEDYDDFVFLVLYGHVPDEDLLVEVHLYVTDGFVVTIRTDESPALDALHESYARRQVRENAVAMVHRIADGLVDSFFPALGQFEDRLELIEDALVDAPKDEHLKDVFTMRRRLAGLRRVLGPQRDLMGRLAAGTAALPGITPEDERYFRDIFDHLLRLSELIESTRDVMSSAIDVYLSASSNRMNAVMKQLALIATIFLPLTFVTGIFGQNFGWMVEHVDSWQAFLLLGVGSQLVASAILLVYFKRRGWF
jgi:magnesium transporter